MFEPKPNIIIITKTITTTLHQRRGREGMTEIRSVLDHRKCAFIGGKEWINANPTESINHPRKQPPSRKCANMLRVFSGSLLSVHYTYIHASQSGTGWRKWYITYIYNPRIAIYIYKLTPFERRLGNRKPIQNNGGGAESNKVEKPRILNSCRKLFFLRWRWLRAIELELRGQSRRRFVEDERVYTSVKHYGVSR